MNEIKKAISAEYRKTIVDINKNCRTYKEAFDFIDKRKKDSMISGTTQPEMTDIEAELLFKASMIEGEILSMVAENLELKAHEQKLNWF